MDETEAWLSALEAADGVTVEVPGLRQRIRVTWFLIRQRPVFLSIEHRKVKFPRVWIIRHVLLRRKA
jgi:hypothetical protein